jgi:hypothetical protein
MGQMRNAYKDLSWKTQREETLDRLTRIVPCYALKQDVDLIGENSPPKGAQTKLRSH